VKKESGRAKKAENEAKKQAAAAADKERQEGSKWSQGAKTDNPRVAEEKARKEATAARKAEAARLLAEEEAAMGNGSGGGKGKGKAGPSSKKPAAAAPRPLAAGGDGFGTTTINVSVNVNASVSNVPSGSGKGKGPAAPAPVNAEEVAESFQATGLDDALDLLDVVNAKADKASMGTAAAGIERHPERRFKAAFEAYLEQELPEIRKEHPGLRLQQYRDLLFKQFQKSPDNPFNQTTVAYDASKTERLDALKRKQEEVEGRLREKKGGGSGSP